MVIIVNYDSISHKTFTWKNYTYRSVLESTKYLNLMHWLLTMVSKLNQKDKIYKIFACKADFSQLLF